MKITRIYTGSDGESHFEDIHVPLQDAGDIGSLSRVFPATGVIFRETDGHYDYRWHNAPCCQLVLMLDGGVEIEASDGEKRIFNSGDILLAEDTSGRGHISKAVNQQARKSVFITLGQQTKLGNE
jgi:hypothetical protein